MTKLIIAVILVASLCVYAIAGGPEEPSHTIHVPWGVFEVAAAKLLQRLERSINEEYLRVYEGMRAARDSADTAWELADTAYLLVVLTIDTASLALFKAIANHDTLDAVRDTTSWALAAQDSVSDTLHGYITFLDQPAGHVEYTIGPYLFMADTFVIGNNDNYDTVSLPRSFADAEYVVTLTSGIVPESDSLSVGLNGRTTSSFVIGKSATRMAQGGAIFWQAVGRK